jgi:hypothetical protein
MSITHLTHFSDALELPATFRTPQNLDDPHHRFESSERKSDLIEPRWARAPMLIMYSER